MKRSPRRTGGRATARRLYRKRALEIAVGVFAFALAVIVVGRLNWLQAMLMTRAQVAAPLSGK